MKRKLIQILLPFILLFACLGFVACGESEELPEQLDTPKNLKIEEGILTWDAVAFADGYYVNINNEQNKTTQCRYDLTELSADKNYTIKVAAYSKKSRVKDSNYVGTSYAVDKILADRGFEFKQSGNTNDYRVTKFGVDKNGVCVIPASYRGGKVVSLSPAKDDDSLLKIKSLYLPSTLSSTTLEVPVAGLLGPYAVFKHFKNLETVDIEASATSNYISEGHCIINKSTNKVVVGGIKSEIPDSVTAIGYYAFAGRNITEITLPDTITKIGSGAFVACELLTSVSLPANLTQIESELFYGCKSLTDISLPSGITEIADTAFMYCESLKSIEIPDNVTSIGAQAFEYCSVLESIAFPSGLTQIGQFAFADCIALKEIVIPAGVNTLKSYSFQNCTALMSVTILGDIPMIDRETFKNCTSLKSIVIPKSVTSVAYEAFNNCSLEEVYYGGTEAEWNAININGTENDSLQSATRYYFSEEQPAKSGNFWHYVDGVPTKWAQ